MEFHHVSVLLNECIEGLKIKENGIYVDGTLGGGGHSLEIVKRLGEGGRLIGIDQDTDALKAAGVSSFQLDEAERGFSYMQDAPLDMRMNSENELCAYDVVNNYSEEALNNVIFGYGEERWAKRIAQFIVAEREKKPIETTFELVEVIKKAIPKGARKDGPHPAKRTFQAIRIEVNRELEILEKTIDDMTYLLNPGGRLCVITFHSLEDRIVKNAFRKQENPCTCPPEFPICVCGKKPKAKIDSSVGRRIRG